ncbi:hypothetical protein CLCR_06501 [Cladophialophora carrionii]|uniref:Uncharacterized protein n=1 Tax=Cladophialophora carrionii TaxID=86049 RepID=A0A1C1C7W4_9EURO|nr:hypothetical protein CLCR_06501 [Cladophialophora carrionii]
MKRTSDSAGQRGFADSVPMCMVALCLTQTQASQAVPHRVMDESSSWPERDPCEKKHAVLGHDSKQAHGNWLD